MIDRWYSVIYIFVTFIAMNNQQKKAELFQELHHSGKMLILPNIWDPLGALLLESLSYPAVATASASVAWADGYNDGEKIPFTDLLTILKRITKSVNIPVTADIESGYASDSDQLAENIKHLIDVGIVGINIEDTDKQTNELNAIDIQCEKIRVIRKAADEKGIHLFINARTDVVIRGNENPGLTDELLKRGSAYKDAGADGFYPIALKDKETISRLVKDLDMPINILTILGIPDLETLAGIGVARVSLGPNFLKIAIRAMKDLAMELKDEKGLSNITENQITSDYLKDLVSKKIDNE